MNDFMTLVCGPLAGPECRRALHRGWVLVARLLAGLAGGCVLLFWLWSSWFRLQIDPYSTPGLAVPIALVALEAMLITVAFVFGPAVLAGTLAGEKDRGTLAMLLTSRLSSYEIVAGRFSSRYAQVATILLAALPAVALTAGVNGLGPAAMATAAVLPAAVALGGAGVALLASALSRRGRDALLAVYLLELLCLLAPAMGANWLPVQVRPWVTTFNPFHGMAPLVWYGDYRGALSTAGLWALLGIAGVTLSAWRLRPVYLRQLGGGIARSRRRSRIPAMNEQRPMLWKELYIERAAALGKAGRWLGLLIVGALLGSSLVLLAATLWRRWDGGAPGNATALVGLLRDWLAGSALPVSWLLQWVVGMRAAGTIASEHQRHTWDAVLVSPLKAAEIVWPKLWGSLYALRGLVAAVVIAWTLALFGGAMEWGAYCGLFANTLAICWFIAAVGVRMSVSSPTANRAMTLTIATWLGAGAVFGAVAAMLVLMIGWLILTQIRQLMGVSTVMAGAPPMPMSFETAWTLVRLAFFIAAGWLIAWYTHRRFDRLAGRLP